MLTIDNVRETLPAQHRQNVTEVMVDKLNNLSKDPEEARYIRDNFVTFANILQEGRYKVGDYVQAVMYVSHKIMNKTNIDAYRATFPDRYQRMIDAKKETKDIASIITAYNKGALVTKIMERAIVPTWILNQDMFQSAINTQFEIMNDLDVSPMHRVDAATRLFKHLKKPEAAAKTELKIDIAMNDGMAALEETLLRMSRKQLDLIQNDPSVSANDIAAMPMKVINP